MPVAGSRASRPGDVWSIESEGESSVLSRMSTDGSTVPAMIVTRARLKYTSASQLQGLRRPMRLDRVVALRPMTVASPLMALWRRV